MCGLRNYAEDGDEDGPSGDEEGAKDHPRGEDIAEEDAGKEGVPQEGDSPKRCENNNRERCDLNEGAEEVGGYEDRWKGVRGGKRYQPVGHTHQSQEATDCVEMSSRYEREKRATYGLRCSTFRCSSGKAWFSTWLLRWIVRPRD